MIHKKKLAIIVLLMLITGLIIYYMYLKPESFIDTSPSCPQITTAPIPVSIVSRFFGIGFNIYPVNNNLYMIEHIPVIYNNTLGSMYALSSEGQLTIKLRNEQDASQWWSLTSKTDTTPYYIITPFNQSNSLALQYENGNLALRPYNEPGFESQKWITSTTKITRGIPVLNYNPASMFTPEFDPYSTTTSTTSSSLAQQNSQQVNDVISTIKANIQQYLNQISNKNSAAGTSTSILGNKDQPLNINLNLGGSNKALGGSTLSAFANLDGATTGADVLSLLDKYESVNNSNTNQSLYSTMDLQNALQSNNGCSNINISEFTSNRVPSCNCKL